MVTMKHHHTRGAEETVCDVPPVVSAGPANRKPPTRLRETGKGEVGGAEPGGTETGAGAVRATLCAKESSNGGQLTTRWAYLFGSPATASVLRVFPVYKKEKVQS